MEPCLICNKVFSSKNSLRTHKSRFHRSKKQILKDVQKSKLIDKKLWQRPMASEKTSENSDIDSNRGYKRRCSSEETSTDSDQSYGETCDEYINRVRRETRKELRKHQNKRIAHKIEKQNMDEKEESITKLGNDESEEDEGNHTKQSIRDVECRGLLHETILESIEKKADRKFKEIEDSIDYIFKETASLGVPYIEKVLYNSLEIQDLFKDNNPKAIQLNINKLKNGARYASGFFKSLGNLTNEEQSLLDTISEASLFKARALLDQNYDILKSMFTALPTFDILQEEVATIKDRVHSKHRYNIYKKKILQDLQIEASSSEGESSDWGIEATEDEHSNSQNEDKIEDDSPESKYNESSTMDKETKD